jgi:hypothetical protein
MSKVRVNVSPVTYIIGVLIVLCIVGAIIKFILPYVLTVAAIAVVIVAAVLIYRQVQKRKTGYSKEKIHTNGGFYTLHGSRRYRARSYYPFCCIAGSKEQE